jgi:large subunit ribosomal protein L17
MTKRGNKRKFGRVRKVRTALSKSLATALIEHGRITTTIPKAKTLAVTVNKMITAAKKQTIASQRALASTLGTKAVTKLVKEIGPSFKDRQGGYTRIIRLPRRGSDGAEMAIIELVS